MAFKEHLEALETEYKLLQTSYLILKDRVKNLPIKFNRWVIMKGYSYSETLSDGKNIIYVHKFKKDETVESLYKDFLIESNIN